MAAKEPVPADSPVRSSLKLYIGTGIDRGKFRPVTSTTDGYPSFSV